MNKYVLPGILFGLGVVVALFGVIVGFFVAPWYIETSIEDTLQLKSGSDAWSDWQLNPVPVYLKFYIWNVTNPNALLVRPPEIPILQEKGPYVFSEIREKIVSKIDERNGTITYRQNITYFFEEALSVDASGNQLSLNDVVNVVNLPFIAISTTIASLNIRPLDEILALLYQDDTFVKEGVTINQVLFEGWEYPGIYGLLLTLAGEMQPQFEGGYFGYYRGKNGSNDGEYMISSGLNDISTLGEILTWNGQPDLQWWDNPSDQTNADKYGDPKYCNQINGTDGAIFPPFLTPETKLPIYSTDLCRSVELVYMGDEDFNGIRGLRYAAADSFYEHPDVNPDNYCFCPSPPDPEMDSSCSKGAIRLFTCQGGPIVTSAPHFYNSEPRFIEALVGMNPVREEHETYLVLQPDSGVPLKVRKRIQMSLEIQNFNNSFHEEFDDLEYFLLPALWASEEVELNDELTNEVNNELITPMTVVDIGKWVLLGIGGLVAVVGVVLFFVRRSN